MKKLLIEMLIIITIVSFGGQWVLKEWRKRYPEPAKLEIEEAELDWERADRIRHIKRQLCDVEKGVLIITRQAKWDLKDELHRLLGESKPVKIYPGIWHKTYLEVVKNDY